MKNSRDRESGKQVDKSPAEIMAEAILEGMAGELILYRNQYGDVIANPLHAVKLYHDFMLKAKSSSFTRARPRSDLHCCASEDPWALWAPEGS